MIYNGLYIRLFIYNLDCDCESDTFSSFANDADPIQSRLIIARGRNGKIK